MVLTRRWLPGLVGGLVVALGLAGCQQTVPSAGQRTAGLAGATAVGPLQIELDDVGARAVTRPAEQLVRAAWGAGQGQLGRWLEAGRPGPAGIAVADDLFVLDGANRRIARYSLSGTLRGYLPLSNPAAIHLTVAHGAVWVLSYLREPKPAFQLSRHGLDGSSVDYPARTDVELPSGLFASGNGPTAAVWVEEEHDTLTRLWSGGEPDQADALVRRLGRPLVGTDSVALSATLRGQHDVTLLKVVEGEGASTLLTLDSPLSVPTITTVAGDRHGRVFLGLMLGREAKAAPYGWQELHQLVLVAHPESGSWRTVALPTDQATEMNQPLFVAADGRIYQMQADEQGVTIRRWTAPMQGGAR